jgi:cysteine desulfurase
LQGAFKTMEKNNDIQKPLYLDYQSTTPCDPRVVEKMLPYLTEHFGNPHSRSHAYGWKAQEAVEEGRLQIAQSIQADPREIIFTSGATESNNLAIKGVAAFLARQKNNEKKHLITSSIEHKCVLEAMRSLEPMGFRVTHLPVDTQGIVSMEALEASLTKDTALVSIMAVSNEIGTIQPIQDMAQLCRQKGVYFHTDAAQAMGRIPLNMAEMDVDLMSLSSHKIYGPKGIGILYVRRNPRVRLDALFSGGGQERGIRSGTLAPFLCVGMGYAALLAQQEQPMEHQRMTALSRYFLDTVFQELPEIHLNGHRKKKKKKKKEK